MKLKVFAVYDAAIAAYAQPFFTPTLGLARRSWQQLVDDPASNVAKYPADFTLFELGEYDDATGQFQNLPTPQNHGTALALIATAGGNTPQGDGLNGSRRDPEVAKKVESVRRAVERHSERTQ